MVISKCYFSKEHIDLILRNVKKQCEHINLENQHITSTVHDAKNILNKKNCVNNPRQSMKKAFAYVNGNESIIQTNSIKH